MNLYSPLSPVLIDLYLWMWSQSVFDNLITLQYLVCRLMYTLNRIATIIRRTGLIDWIERYEKCWWLDWDPVVLEWIFIMWQIIGVGYVGGARAPLKFGQKYFSGNYYVKFGHFSGKNHVKFWNFINFSGKYQKFGHKDNFSGKNRVKFGHIADF